VCLELRGQLGDALGAPPQRRRRADDGERQHPLGPARGERAGDNPADLRADQMEAVHAERIQKPRVVVDDDVERPREVARHRRRRAVAAHVRPHDAESPRQERHPRVPGLTTLGIAVQQHDRRGLPPGLGEVVDPVVQAHAGSHLERRHGYPPLVWWP